MSNSKNQFGKRPFSDIEYKDVDNKLKKRLEEVSYRQGFGGVGQLAYLESWKAIETANDIFGFNGWSCDIINLQKDYEKEIDGKFEVSYTSIVKITLKDGTYHQDVGCGNGTGKKLHEAIEKAQKEAVSDARKRSLKNFGNILGNSLYDKDYLKELKNIKKTTNQSVPNNAETTTHTKTVTSTTIQETKMAPKNFYQNKKFTGKK